MATPTEKKASVEKAITSLTGIDRKACIENNICTMCGCEAINFRNEGSRKEYSIGGMCQPCQDLFFGA